MSDVAHDSIPLITSLPPTLSRRDAGGADVGAAYRERCIESWRQAGFEPVSVNSTSESSSPSVRTIPVGRDASAITGRPNVFLADLLAAAAKEAAGRPFVLMNADLLIRPGTALAASVLGLRPGEFIFSRRIDIQQPDQTEGKPFLNGYDFFAGHADDISGLPDGGFAFGASWWDYYLPLMMFARGCRLYQTEPAVLHLVHPITWLDASWETLGARFIDQTREHVVDERFRSRLDDALHRPGGRPLANLKYSAWRRLPRNAALDRKRKLLRVSVASMSFLNEVAAPRTVMAHP